MMTEEIQEKKIYVLLLNSYILLRFVFHYASATPAIAASFFLFLSSMPFIFLYSARCLLFTTHSSFTDIFTFSYDDERRCLLLSARFMLR